MALPPASPDRSLKHRRAIDVQVFARVDGLWEVDARLSDVKTRDWPLGGTVRPAGTPVHDMLLRLVVDAEMTIVAAGAQTAWMPYPGDCDAYGDAYERLAGLNLLRNFRRALKERVGGALGCTHLNELAQLLPTAVIQAFASEVPAIATLASGSEQPFQIDRCHALRSDGEVVRTHYPRWHRPSAAHNAQPATQDVPRRKAERSAAPDDSLSSRP